MVRQRTFVSLHKIKFKSQLSANFLLCKTKTTKFKISHYLSKKITSLQVGNFFPVLHRHRNQLANQMGCKTKICVYQVKSLQS
jgi:uncharacterized protein with WD repeat